MENFNQNKHQNPAFDYYPESMIFDSEKKVFRKAQAQVQQHESVAKEDKTEESPAQPRTSDSKTPTLSSLLNGNNPLASMLGNSSNNMEGNPLANMLANSSSNLGGSPLSALFSNKFLGNSNSSDKNNMMMQAFNTMFNSPKTKSTESHKEKIVDVSNSFEDM